METIFSPEILTTLFGGAVITLVTNLVKDKLGKYNPQYVVLALSLVFAGVYMVFKNFLPVDFQMVAVSYLVQTLGISVFIYEFIWKNLSSK